MEEYECTKSWSKTSDCYAAQSCQVVSGVCPLHQDHHHTTQPRHGDLERAKLTIVDFEYSHENSLNKLQDLESGTQYGMRDEKSSVASQVLAIFSLGSAPSMA